MKTTAKNRMIIMTVVLIVVLLLYSLRLMQLQVVEGEYQRLIGRVHSLSSFPFFAFSHLSRAARHSSNVGLTQEDNSLSMGWR